jgi:regulator of sirC expression with transglutaminase-like and TPR domain
MDKVTGIIRIEQLSGTKKYLDLDTEGRRNLCKKIIVESLARMTVKATEAERREVMKQLLKNSLVFYESQEEYENCEIFKGLLEVVD